MQHEYFAASNSSEGFKSYYPEVFGRADRLYVIKGGPGTGKSSFIKKCAESARKNSLEVEYYYCSSDPRSLDGVLMLGEENIGIIDGTSPHVWEPIHPGAREEMINLGQFWDPRLLRLQKNEIFSLSNKKSAAYKRAYDYLRSCGNLRAVSDSLLSQFVDREKLQAAADRLVRSLDLPRGTATVIPSLLDAVAMTGRFSFDSFEQNADKVVRIDDFYGVGKVFLVALLRSLSSVGETVRVAYDPVDFRLVNGIFLENGKIAFLLWDKDNTPSDEGKIVNAKRFVDVEKLRVIRGELRYATRLYSDCLDGALHALREAKVYHFLLEDIYKNAMDFKALNEFTYDFIAKLSL
ncbi:MAG: hypothetical protein IJD74_02670 [Clostridia bacterium]|nr:hypothetical protein [Clostridia bacterium]